MKTRYKNVTVNPDRHGKLRARFRKAGQKAVYMKHLPDQPGFDAEYKALMTDGAPKVSRAIPGSVNDLIERYYRSAAFRGKSGPQDLKRRRALVESFRADFGNDQVADFGFEHIEAILLARTEQRTDARGKKVGGQVAAVDLRKQLRRLFAYAKKLQWIGNNPVEEAGEVGQRKITGFYTWTEADIAQFKAHHALGTKARLALEIILWTGQRRGDARLFGPRHIVRGKINFTASKNDADLWLPISPDLRAAIDAMPSVGISTYLVTDYGKPFSSSASFGNKFRDWCDEAGLKRCTAHGLRKAIGRRLAESQATQQQIKAVGGWKHDAEVATYVAGAEQERLADAAMSRLFDSHGGGKDI